MNGDLSLRKRFPIYNPILRDANHIVGRHLFDDSYTFLNFKSRSHATRAFYNDVSSFVLNRIYVSKCEVASLE